MDSSWTRIIAASGGDAAIDGDRASYRLTKKKFRNACGMHAYAERVRSGDLPRPGASDTDPCTPAQFDDVNRKIYSATVMLLSDVLSGLHDPNNDAAVTDGDGFSLWARQSGCPVRGGHSD